MNEVRLAVRSLRRRPGFASLAVGTLALSVGMATLVFSLFEGVLLKPLPYPNEEQLHRVYGTNTDWREAEQPLLRDAWDRAGISLAMVRAWEGLGPPLERVGAFQEGSAALALDGPAEEVAGARVNVGFFEALGVPALIGRAPLPEEVERRERLLVIGERLWSRRLGRDPDVIGRSATLDGRSYTIVGVMPVEFAVPSRGTEWWTPFGEEWVDLENAAVLGGIARLAQGGSRTAATQALNAEVRGLTEVDASYEVMGARLVPLREELLGDVRQGIMMLFGAVGVIALIACVNLTNLVLARGQRRLPELAMRAALGAGRGGVVGAMLSEVAVVCVLGVVLGIGLAALARAPMVTLLTGAVQDFPRAEEIELNGLVLSFSGLVAVGSALIAGLVPALAASARAPWQILQAGAKGARSRGARRIQRLLLTTEAGLAMVLLVGAGLLTRSLAGVLMTDPGFESRGMAFMRVSLPTPPGASPEVVSREGERFRVRLGRLPGVTTVVPVAALPAVGGTRFGLARREGVPAEQAGLVAENAVGPEYFEALRIPVLQGRTFTRRDGPGGEPVAVLSASLAQRFFGDADPVGRFVTQSRDVQLVGGRAVAGEEETVRVIGVVGDIRQVALIREEDPLIYRPWAQAPTRILNYVLTTSGDPADLLPGLRTAASGVSDLVIRDLGEFRRSTFAIYGPVQVRTLLLSLIAALAAFLSMVGVYGVVSYVVADQTHEIGVRMTLGSRARGEALRMVRHALAPTLVGAVAGLAVAWAASKTLESAMFGISRLDPWTYAATFVLLAVAALSAAWVPARRASRVDPVRALAAE